MRLLWASIGACVLLGATAHAQTPSWIVSELLDAARAEGGVTVYSSINEQEALPLWKLFETATGVPVAFVRASDGQLTSRITIEARAGKTSWDVLQTVGVTKIPQNLRKEFSPPQAQSLPPAARDPQRRWYGVAASYNAPAYNTKFIQRADLPQSIEQFIAKKEWRGRVAIDAQEFYWLRALVLHFGEERGRKLARDFVDALAPVPIDGHLALARAISAGEYWVTPANYVSLTNNQIISGEPTDYWGIAPIGVFYSQVAVSAAAPHPKAAELAANFLLSREAQQFVTRLGRLPTRPDVTPNPPEAITKLGDAKVIPLEFTPEDERYWQREFQSLIRPR